MATRTPHMSPPPVDRRRPGLVWPVRIDPAGVIGPTRGQARGPRWTRGSHGFYLPSDLDPALATDQRIVTAAALLPTGGAVTGWAALRWLGTRHLDGHRSQEELPVPLAVPPDTIKSRQGIVLARDAHLRSTLVEVDGLTVSTPAAAAAFEVRHAHSLPEAVAVLDRVAAADLASLDELRAFAESLAGRRWVSRLDLAIGYAEENCWSPTETTMRLRWRTLGLTHVVCNRPVFDRDGRFLGTPDLLDLDAGVVGEYDGGLHLAGAQRAKDIRREGVFRRAGLEYVEMVAADLRDPADFDQRTRDAVARAVRLERQWTIEPPPGWVETHTVQLRRNLSEWDRVRFLRWQTG